MTKVSVIIPVYNTEKYLKECLDSIINQTLKDIEIICIDDGSTDNSLKLLKNYEKQDNRITVISQENNGLSITRNNGMKLSNGKYVYFIDSDDYLELTAIEEIYNISEENDLDLLIFKLINFNDGSNEKYTSEYYEMDSLNYFKNKVFNYKDIGENALNFAVSTPGKFFKKELIENMRFPENLIFEDNLFFAEAMLKAKRVYFYDKHLYNRRIRENSITTSKNIKFADSIIIINRIIDLTKKFGVYNDFKYGLAKKKIDSAFNRYSLVDEEFKEEFFNKITMDFKDFEEEYEEDLIKHFDENYKYIFRSFIYSNNHKEFDLKIEILNLKNEIKYLEKYNKKLKNKNRILTNKNKKLLSSKSWRITKPLRKIFNLKH